MQDMGSKEYGKYCIWKGERELWDQRGAGNKKIPYDVKANDEENDILSVGTETEMS